MRANGFAHFDERTYCFVVHFTFDMSLEEWNKFYSLHKNTIEDEAVSFKNILEAFKYLESEHNKQKEK